MKDIHRKEQRNKFFDFFVNKKGQMEIMGLIVIVILLTLGMFFVVTLKTNQPKTNIKKSYEQDQLAANFIIAFLKTSTECEPHTLENMIQDCALEKKIMCGTSSCTYVNNTARNIIAKTFDAWEKDYEFTIEGLKDRNINLGGCTGVERDTAFQPISLYPYPGTVVVKLALCGS